METASWPKIHQC